jgi:hypothetical protein
MDPLGDTHAFQDFRGGKWCSIATPRDVVVGGLMSHYRSVFATKMSDK